MLLQGKKKTSPLSLIRTWEKAPATSWRDTTAALAVLLDGALPNSNFVLSGSVILWPLHSKVEADPEAAAG